MAINVGMEGLIGVAKHRHSDIEVVGDILTNTRGQNCFQTPVGLINDPCLGM